MKYFTNFPIINYSFESEVIPMTNIFIRPDAVVTFSPEVYGQYTNFVEDGMSPDDASRLIYNNDDYFWFILLQNKIMNLYKEWPTSYSYWLTELTQVYPGETFYNRYILNIKPGDIVAKVNTQTPENPYEFDKNNCGVVISYDPFLRAFDVVRINGEVKEGDNFYILRQTGISYEHVKNPNNETIHKLERKEQKVNSVAEFNLINQRGNLISISPYSNSLGTDLESHTIEDIFECEDCLLTLFMKRQNYNGSYKTFSQTKEQEWVFRKNIKTIPITDLNLVDNAYSEIFLDEDQNG